MARSQCFSLETAPGTMGLYIMPVTVRTTHTNFPFPVPVPVPISVYEPLHRYCKLWRDQRFLKKFLENVIFEDQQILSTIQKLIQTCLTDQQFQ